MDNKEKISVTANINAPIKKVWEYYNTPEHITKWNTPAPGQWHTPTAENDLREGGKFVFRMEPIVKVNPEEGFDFGGTYDEVVEDSLIKYTLGDGRQAIITLSATNEALTHIEIAFDPENENAPEFQQQGWQAILNNFKSYVEAN